MSAADDAVVASIELHRARWAYSQQKTRETRLRERRLQDAYFAARDHACAELAERRGWRYTRKPFGLRNLIEGSSYRSDVSRHYPEIDHPECFRELARPYRPVAILSHSYQTDFMEHVAFAAEHGLSAEVVPVSWYLPGGTLAVLYTRNDSLAAAGRGCLILEGGDAGDG
ncbi:MAG: hypothetical protein WD270_03720 [Acetobacterales bacterium]